MTEIQITRFPPGGLHCEPEQVVVRWRDRSGQAREGTLPEALADSDGQPVGLVLSAADVLMTEVEVGRKQARHLGKILPYLLEERLAVEPESQWFSVGKPANGHYPVVVADGNRIRRLHQWLLDQGAVVAGMAVDAQLLSDMAPVVCADPDQVLVVKGAEMAASIPAEQLDDYVAALAIPISEYSSLTANEMVRHLGDRWAQRLELFHGELRVETGQSSSVSHLSPLWRQTLMAAGILLLCVWSLAWVQAWQYDRLETRAREASATLYQTLFPGDRATARLSQQFRSRLSQLNGGVGGDTFISLMGPVGAVLAKQREAGTQPRRLVYEQRDGVLLLDVEANSYEQLESLKKEIESNGFVVELANFRNQGERVAARIKVASS